MKEEKMYMNPATGIVATYAGWWYKKDGSWVNAVDRGEVVKVIWNEEEQWWEEDR